MFFFNVFWALSAEILAVVLEKRNRENLKIKKPAS